IRRKDNCRLPPGAKGTGIMQISVRHLARLRLRIALIGILFLQSSLGAPLQAVERPSPSTPFEQCQANHNHLQVGDICIYAIPKYRNYAAASTKTLSSRQFKQFVQSKPETATSATPAEAQVTQAPNGVDIRLPFMQPD